MAAELAVRQDGLPAMDLWKVLLGREVKCEFLEDNQAAIRVIETGKNPTLRYLGRTHLVDIAWLVERFKESAFELKYCTSEEQGADIFTKHFTLVEKWQEVRKLIGTMSYEELFPIGKVAMSKSKSKPKTGPYYQGGGSKL